jgi:tetratricopeptide (TPR) repeat protein
MPVRATLFALFMLLCGIATAQQAPPLPPFGAGKTPPPPGLTPTLAEATRMIHDGEYATAMAKIDDVLAADARNPQARFLKGVVQTDQGEVDDAAATFQELTEDYPELPEPHNNLAVIWAQKGEYERARAELQIALAAHPDYAIAHENLGDIYVRLAGSEYDRALKIDKANKSAQAKLVLVRELYAVAPSTAPPKPAAVKPAAIKPASPPKIKK